MASMINKAYRESLSSYRIQILQSCLHKVELVYAEGNTDGPDIGVPKGTGHARG